MANTIYKFEDGFEEGYRVKGGHYLKLWITFSEIGITGGTDTVKRADECGLKMKRWGELEIGDIDENIINYGEYSFVFYDGEDEMFDFLLDPATPNVYDKSALVTLWVKYNGESAYVEKYRGYVDQESLEDCYDYKTKMFSFSAYPRTDILKQYWLHQEGAAQETEATNGYALDPLGYTYIDESHYGHNLKYIQGKKLVDVITDIYKKIDSNITLVVQDDIVWRGYKNATDYHDFTFNDIYLGIPAAYETNFYQSANDSFLAQVFGTYNTFFGIKDLSELLKKLALSFCFTTGMDTATRAYVRSIYSYDETNVQSLGTVKNITYGLLPTKDAVKITCRKYKKETSEKNIYGEVTYDGVFDAVSPLLSQRYISVAACHGDNILEEEIITWAQMYTSGTSGGGGTLFGVHNNELYRIIRASKDDAVSFFQLNGPFQCKVLWQLRGAVSKNRVIKISTNGIDYSYLKDFNYANGGYQVYRLKTNFDDNSTEISGIKIESIEDETVVEEIPAPSLRLGTISSGFYKTYNYVYTMTYQDGNLGDFDIVTVPADCYVKDIEVVIITGFDVTDFYIADADETLVPGSEMTYEEDNQSIRQVIMKNYTTQGTIKGHCTGTATHGAANIIVTVLKRES